MEYVERGDLSELMRNQALPLDLSRFYTAELVNALQFLHENNIIHRDLKPQNILLSKKFHLKIVSDFYFTLKLCRLILETQRDMMKMKSSFKRIKVLVMRRHSLKTETNFLSKKWIKAKLGHPLSAHRCMCHLKCWRTIILVQVTISGHSE